MDITVPLPTLSVIYLGREGGGAVSSPVPPVFTYFSPEGVFRHLGCPTSAHVLTTQPKCDQSLVRGEGGRERDLKSEVSRGQG